MMAERSSKRIMTDQVLSICRTDNLVPFVNGDVIWFKLNDIWRPCKICKCENVPNSLTYGYREQPLAFVKFFDEEKYDAVRSTDTVYPYDCDRKSEFIKKGLVQLRNELPRMEKFKKDISIAERLTNGDRHILKRLEYEIPVPCVVPNNYLFVKSTTREKKKPNKPPVCIRSFKRRKDKNTISLSSGHVTRILIQEPIKANQHKTCVSSKSGVLSKRPYKCQMCSFTATRINLIVMHTKLHSEERKKIILREKLKFSDENEAIDRLHLTTCIEERHQVRDMISRQYFINNLNGTPKEPVNITVSQLLTEWGDDIALNDNDDDRRQDTNYNTNQLKVLESESINTIFTTTLSNTTITTSSSATTTITTTPPNIINSYSQFNAINSNERGIPLKKDKERYQNIQSSDNTIDVNLLVDSVSETPNADNIVECELKDDEKKTETPDKKDDDNCGDDQFTICNEGYFNTLQYMFEEEMNGAKSDSNDGNNDNEIIPKPKDLPSESDVDPVGNNLGTVTEDSNDVQLINDNNEIKTMVDERTQLKERLSRRLSKHTSKTSIIVLDDEPNLNEHIVNQVTEKSNSIINDPDTINIDSSDVSIIFDGSVHEEHSPTNDNISATETLTFMSSIISENGNQTQSFSYIRSFKSFSNEIVNQIEQHSQPKLLNVGNLNTTNIDCTVQHTQTELLPDNNKYQKMDNCSNNQNVHIEPFSDDNFVERYEEKENEQMYSERSCQINVKLQNEDENKCNSQIELSDEYSQQNAVKQCELTYIDNGT